MTHLISIDRVRYLLDTPGAMKAYRDKLRADKHRRAAEAMERQRRRIAGHGG